MKPIAVLACTQRGAAIARRLTERLRGAQGFAPDSAAGLQPLPLGLGTTLRNLYGSSRAIIVVGAVGVAVRLVAPLISGKATDPAVVAVDDAGRFAIPLLSGHRGGANALAEEIADLIGATAVVTTASEAFGLPAADLLGSGLGWTVSGEAGLRAVSAAFVNGDPVAFWQAAGQPLTEVDGWQEREAVRLVACDGPDALREAIATCSASAAIAISDGFLPEKLLADATERCALYRPRTLVAGVGCARGASAGEILALLAAGLNEAGLAAESLGALASIDRKQDEPGILEAAGRLGLRVHFFTAAELSAVEGVENPSQTVRGAVGTPSVAEAAALLAAGPGALLALPKRKSSSATVAIARRAAGLPLEVAHPRAGSGAGELLIVGLGPGDEAQITIAARHALRTADVIVGYRRYLDLLRPWLGAKVYLPSEITEEEERARTACRLAARGLRTALVSSGDAGVYGMATLAFAILEQGGWDGEHPPVRVLPGVTAATAAAALLGAPLTSDFAAISLSDLLTPWPVIEQRLQAAAQADFAIAIYNPRSRARQANFERACEILRQARGDDTPVGIVLRAYRTGQEIRLTTLAQLSQEEVDMTTIVLLGSGNARLVRGRLVTPRGYLAERRAAPSGGVAPR